MSSETVPEQVTIKKKTTPRYLFFLLPLLLILVCLIVTGARHDHSIRVLQNISYVAESTNPKQQLDLYYPSKASTPVPLVVFIHGGGWAVGDKKQSPAEAILSAGFAAASINYRLTDEATFPAQIYDCKAAIRWLRAHASEYNIDPNRIGVFGASAGGHLASLLGTSSDVRDLEGTEGNDGVSSAVQAVCDWNGPIDFFTIQDEAGPQNSMHFDDPDGYVARLFNGLPAQKKELASQASPSKYISADDPPFLIVHGDKDDIVPIQQSKDFYKELQTKGVKSKFVIVKDGSHMLFATDTLTESMKFFQDVFGKS